MGFSDWGNCRKGGEKRTRLSDSACGGASQTLAVASQLFLILSHFEVCRRDDG